MERGREDGGRGDGDQATSRGTRVPTAREARGPSGLQI